MSLKTQYWNLPPQTTVSMHFKNLLMIVCGSFQSCTRQEYSQLTALVKDRNTLTALEPFWSSKISIFQSSQTNCTQRTPTCSWSFIQFTLCTYPRIWHLWKGQVTPGVKQNTIYFPCPGSYWSTSTYPSTPPATTKQLCFLALSPPFILLPTINEFKQIPLTSPTVVTIHRNTYCPIVSTVFETQDKGKLGQRQRKGLVLVQKTLS